MKILSFLASFISKTKTDDIFNFLSVKYFSKSLLFLKISHIRVNYCWSYGLPNLLFRFFRYRLGNLDKRQAKIAENSTIFFFKASTKASVSWKFQVLWPTHPTQNDGSLNFFIHILMVNFSKLQTFGLTELNNMSKGQLADRIFKLWKSCAYDYQGVELYFLKF